MHPDFADEGAANHVRLCASHGEPGVELFVYGREPGEDGPGFLPGRPDYPLRALHAPMD
jgi:succinylarginine dihydrolase